MHKAWCAVLCAVVYCYSHDSLASADTAEKDGATVTVLALGTSLTANYQWPNELSTQLSRCLRRKVEIENLARAGANSDQAVKQFSSRVIRRPDIVLIEFATNDASLLRGIGIDDSQKNHRVLLGRIRKEAPDAHVLLMTMNPVFGLRGWVRPRLSAYFEMYRQLALGGEVTLVDFVHIWSKSLEASDYEVQLPDGLHPTQAAASDVILPVLQRRIGDLIHPGIQNACVSSP